MRARATRLTAIAAAARSLFQWDLSLDFTTGVLPAGVSFSRGSNATMIDSLGRLVWAPHQLIRNPHDLTIGPWVALGASPPVITGGQSDPFGGNGAFLIDIRPASDCRVAQTTLATASVPDNCVVTFSMWLRRAPGETESTHVAQYRRKDATTQTVVLPVSDAWSLVSFTFNSGSGASPVLIWLNIQVGPTIKQYIVFRPQLNLGDATTFYPNPTALAEWFGPRFDYNPTTLEPRGLLVESQRTNLISSGMAVAAWAATNGAAIASPATIQGWQAVRIAVTVLGAAQFGYVAAPTTFAATTRFTSSVRVKRGNVPRVQLTVTNNAFQPAGTDAYANYNFDTDTLVVAGSSTPAPTGARVLNSDGSVTLSLTYTSGSSGSGSGAGVILAFIDSDNSTRLAGTAVSGAYVDAMGPQCEVGNFASSLIPTFGTSTPRLGDLVDLVGAPPYSQAGTTIYWSFERQGLPLASSSEASSGAFYFGRATTDAIGGPFGFGTPVQYRADLVSGGAQAAALSVPSVAGNPFVVIRAAARFQTDNARMAANGVLSTPDTSCVMPAALDLQHKAIGRRDAATTMQMNGWMRALRFRARPATDEQLQALTA